MSFAFLTRRGRHTRYGRDWSSAVCSSDLPAGPPEEDDPAACARREALEEAGLTLRALEPAGAVWTMPGISTERMHLYLAPYGAADRTGEGGGVAGEHENITLCETPLADLAAAADGGRLSDLKTFAL